MKRLVIILVLVCFLGILPPIQASAISYSYDQLTPFWQTNFTKEEFNQLVKEIKHPKSYIEQWQALEQYSAFTTEWSLRESFTREIVVYETEIARLKAFIDEVKPSSKNAKKISRVAWGIKFLYNGLYDVSYPYFFSGHDPLIILFPNVEGATITLDTIDPERLTPNSLNWVNKQIELITTILGFAQDKVSDWDTAKETVDKLLHLYEIRHEFFMAYIKTHEVLFPDEQPEQLAIPVFPDQVDYLVPTWKLGN